MAFKLGKKTTSGKYLLIALVSLVAGIILGKELTDYYTKDWLATVNSFVSDNVSYSIELSKINDSLGKGFVLIEELNKPGCIEKQECIQRLFEESGRLDGEIKVRAEKVEELKEKILNNAKKLGIGTVVENSQPKDNRPPLDSFWEETE